MGQTPAGPRKLDRILKLTQGSQRQVPEPQKISASGNSANHKENR